LALVVDPVWVKVAALSTEKLTGMPVSAWPEDVVAVAVAVTVVAPLLLMLDELSCRVKLLADAPAPLAPLALPKGEVPALPPPPPQDTIKANTAAAARFFRCLFMRSSQAVLVSADQRAAVRSVTIFGVRKIRSSVFDVEVVLVLKRLPR